MQQPKIIELPRFTDPRGNLSLIEEESQIPFKIARTYWIYDVPGGENRGGHAYKENQEFIIAMSGSFDVILTDGTHKQTFTLNRSHYGLYIPKGWWRELDNFSTNSFCLILSSTRYTEEDYIYNYKDFLTLKTNGEI